jgi:hypothetical protein
MRRPKASRVRVIQRDGTETTTPAYNLPQLQQVLRGGKPPRPGRAPRKRRHRHC